MEEQPSGFRIRYADYTTIDWAHDLAKDRIKRKKLQSSKRGWRGLFARAFDASQAWIILTLVGIASGTLAAFIDLASEWLSDVKFGFCQEAWYLNKHFCCWQEPSKFSICGEGLKEYDSGFCLADETCPKWIPWGGQASPTSAGQYALGFFVYVVFAILFASIAAVLVRTYAPYAAGSGIPEVKTILSGFIIRKFLGVWTLIIKSLGLILSVASNLSLGKEGPLVHVACCLGNIFPRFFTKFKTNEAKKREILTAAASAGVSVAFGAPVGGVLFALEEVSYYFPYKTLWRCFFCAMAAAVTLQLWNPFRTNQLVLFQVRYSRPWHAFELFWFVLLGVFGGLFGTMFIRLNIRVQRWRRQSAAAQWPIAEAALLGAVTAVFGYLNVFTRVNMTELVSHLFEECDENDYHGLCDPSQLTPTILSLILVAIFRGVLTIVTFGISVPAGIFIPSMAVGASFGRMLGLLAQFVHRSSPSSSIFWSCPAVGPCITPGTYAMVGAAASLAGVTRMTVSLVVIVFELTGALNYVLPVMIAVMVAKWVADALEPDGIYDALIRLKGYPFLDSRATYRGKELLRDIMTPVERLRKVVCDGMTLSELDQMLKDEPEPHVNGYPVVLDSQSNYFSGYVGRLELQFALQKAKLNPTVSGNTMCRFSASKRSIKEQKVLGGVGHLSSPLLELNMMMSTNNDTEIRLPLSTSSMEDPSINFHPWMDQTPMLMSSRMPVEVVMELFRKLGLRYLVVCDQGRLMGLVTKKDLLRHLDMQH